MDIIFKFISFIKRKFGQIEHTLSERPLINGNSLISLGRCFDIADFINAFTVIQLYEQNKKSHNLPEEFKMNNKRVYRLEIDKEKHEYKITRIEK